MAVTTAEAIAAVRARLNAGSYTFPLYFNGDDPVIPPDVPAPFGFVVFNNEGSVAVSYGGGRGETMYRNRARVEIFVFSPMGYGAETVAAHAETVAVRLRSFRNDVISCFSADVIPVGPGSNLSASGLPSDVSNYQCALVEALLFFDQTGGAIVDPVPPDGGGAPDWVPANAKIHIDFLGGSPQGRAWSNGAEVAVDTLLGSDPNTENGWNATFYEPENLDELGLQCGEHPAIALIGTALATMLAGATIRIQKLDSAEDGGPFYFIVMAADGVDAVRVMFNETLTANSYNGPMSLSTDGNVANAIGAANCFAVTLVSNRIDICANGHDPLTSALVNADRPVENPSVAVAVDMGGGGHLQSVTIYDPLPTTSGLSELSEP